jgi:hypothetical protein
MKGRKKKTLKDYRLGIEEYSKRIEKATKELAPKVNKKMAVIGFLVAAAGISPVLLIKANSLIAEQPVSTPYYVLFFFCFIIFFIGYMIIHRSTSSEWL